MTKTVQKITLSASRDIPFNQLDRDIQAMHRRRVGQDELDRADIHAERHGSRTVGRAPTTEPDGPLSIEFSHRSDAQLTFQHPERRRLRATEVLADLVEVGDVQVDQIAEKC